MPLISFRCITLPQKNGLPEESGVTVDIDLTRRLKAQGEINAEGGSSVGLGFELEY